MVLNKFKNLDLDNTLPLLIVLVSIIIGIVYIHMSNYMNIYDDIWHVMNVGRYIVENGFYGYNDPFTVNDYCWNPQQWLSGVLCYLFYENNLIWLFVVVSYVANVAIVYLTIKTVSSSEAPGYLISILTSLFAFEYALRFNAGPRIFDYIALCASVLIVLNFNRNKNVSFNVILFSAMSSVFINIHSTLWLEIFLFPLLYLIFNFNKENLKFTSLLILFGLLSGFINPYGVEFILNSPKSLLFMNSDLFSGVPELKSGLESIDSLLLLFSAILFLVFVIIKKRSEIKSLKDIVDEYSAFLLISALATLSSNRNVVILTVAICLFISYNHRFFTLKQQIQPVVCNIFTLIIGLMLVLNVNSVNYLIGINIINSDDIDLNPIINSVKNEYGDKQGLRIFNNHCGAGEGQYISYELRSKFFMDNRLEMTLKLFNGKEDTYGEIVNRTSFNELNNKYNFDLALIYTNADNGICYEIEHGGGELITKTEYFKLYKVS